MDSNGLHTIVCCTFLLCGLFPARVSLKDRALRVNESLPLIPEAVIRDSSQRSDGRTCGRKRSSFDR